MKCFLACSILVIFAHARVNEHLQQRSLRDVAPSIAQEHTTTTVVGKDEPPLLTSKDLFNRYDAIFKSGNRNAASHLWASYILTRSVTMTPETLRQLFMSFCPISGSPISVPEQSRWYYPGIASLDNAKISGNVHHCCWPCVCDTQAFLLVDTKTVTTSAGPRKFNFLVYGNPCTDPSQIPEEAPDVRCSGGKLIGATLSDKGHIIVGMLHTASTDTASRQTVTSVGEMCQQRAASGYQSGMGKIFIDVASINPIGNMIETPANPYD